MNKNGRIGALVALEGGGCPSRTKARTRLYPIKFNHGFPPVQCGPEAGHFICFSMVIIALTWPRFETVCRPFLLTAQPTIQANTQKSRH